MLVGFWTILVFLPEYRFSKSITSFHLYGAASTDYKTLHLTDNSCNRSRSHIKTEIQRLQYSEKARNKYSSGTSFKTYVIKFFEDFFFAWMTQKILEIEFEMNLYIPQRKGHREHEELLGRERSVLYEQSHYLKLHIALFLVSLSNSAKLQSSWLSQL